MKKLILNWRQEHYQWSIKCKLKVGKEIVYSTEVLKSNFCDYNNAYILVRCDFPVIGRQATQTAFTNCALFTKCITKIDGATIDDAEDLDLDRNSKRSSSKRWGN